MTEAKSSRHASVRHGLRAGPKILMVPAVTVILSLFALTPQSVSAATYSKTVNIGGVVLTLAADYSPIWDWNQRNLVNLKVVVDEVQSSSGDLRILGAVATLHQNGTDHLFASSNSLSRLENALLSQGEAYSVAFSFDHTFTNQIHAGEIYRAHILLRLNLLAETANASKPYTFMNGDSDMVMSLNTSNPHPPALFLGLSMWALLAMAVAVILLVGAFLLWLSRGQQNQPTTGPTSIHQRTLRSRSERASICRALEVI